MKCRNASYVCLVLFLIVSKIAFKMFTNDDNDDCDDRLPGVEDQTPMTSTPETPSAMSTTTARSATTSVNGGQPMLDKCVEGSVPTRDAIHVMKTKMMLPISDPVPSASHKVSIIGAGMVGMACAFSILTQDVSSEVCIVDVDTDKVMGEMMDLQHGSAFIRSAKITAGNDYSLTADSKVIVVTAGARQREGETRLSLLQRNTNILKSIIPAISKSSPNAILLIVSNPVDVLTCVSWKLSGFPRNRVFGSGTNLDTARFRFLVAKRLGVATESVNGWILGEHGDTSVAVWSALDIAGARLKDINEKLGTDDDPDDWKCVHQEVIRSAYDVIKLKGYTSWAIGLSTADLTMSVLRNKNAVHCVSVPVKNMYGIDNEAYLSLPCIIGEQGVVSVIRQKLNEEEMNKLRQSSKIIDEHIKNLSL